MIALVFSIIVYGIIIFNRKRKWYILHVLGDFTNPHNQQYTMVMGEKFEKGVMTGKVYKSYTSFGTAFTINSIPDLQSYQFGKHLFVYRGVTGLAGDVNFTFVMPPIIARPSADKLVNKLTTDISNAMTVGLKNLTEDQRKELESSQDKMGEFIIKTINSDWVAKNIGIITLKKEDVLLREDRVVHAAINADSADFAKAHMDRWQKFAQMLVPITICILLIGVGIGSYILYTGFTNSQQATLTYDRFLITELDARINTTNAYNAWLYADLKAIQVYGVQLPTNFTQVTVPPTPTGTSLIPTIPTIP